MNTVNWRAPNRRLGSLGQDHLSLRLILTNIPRRRPEAALKPECDLQHSLSRGSQGKIRYQFMEGVMIESKSQTFSDDDLEHVTGGRKAGEGQKDDGPSSPAPPPTPIETLVRWIISLIR
jgi:hypothetical protein